MVIPKLCLWSLENDGGRNGSPGSMSAVVLCATPTPLMTRFETKAWLVLPLPCWTSTHCPCSEFNGFRDKNSLCVSRCGAKQIAALKSPTTYCYKSIKHLQLTIQPPASAAEHVNSCDQIAAQLTAFTCAPTVPISRGEILARLPPTGWRPGHGCLGVGWGTLEPYSLWLPGSGAEGERAEAAQAAVGPLSCPCPPLPLALRASDCCGRPDLLPDFPRTRSCWSCAIGFMVRSQARLGVPWGAPSRGPTTLTGVETAFVFIPPRLQRRFCLK